MESTNTLARAINIIERVNGRASTSELAVTASRSQSSDMDTRHPEPNVLALLRQSPAEELRVVCTSTTASSLSVVLDQLTVVTFPSDDLDHSKGGGQNPVSLQKAISTRTMINVVATQTAVAKASASVFSLPS